MCRIHRHKQRGRPRTNIARTKLPDLFKHFANTVDENLHNQATNILEERWNHIQNDIYNSDMDAFKKREAKLIKYKRKHSGNFNTPVAFRETRNDVQRTVRRKANDYWLNLNIQLSPDCGNIHAMYDGKKKAFGPCIIKVTPLKSHSWDIITDRRKQMQKWAQRDNCFTQRRTVLQQLTIPTLYQSCKN